MPNNDTAQEHIKTAFTLRDETIVFDISEFQKFAIQDIYDAYDAGYGRPSEALKGPNLCNDLNDAIYSAYNETQQGRRLFSVRNELKLLAERCPFCGINPVTDLDHYLPRSVYKPLSIYVRNLIPSCGICNNKKRAIDGENNSERLIHAYFDLIPRERFFFADVAIVEEGLTVVFVVRQSASMSGELFDRLCFQVERLQLNSRYKSEVNIFLGSQATALEDAFGVDKNGERLRIFLLRSSTTSELRFGMNDWRTALLLGLAECQEFCNGAFTRCLGF